MTTTATALREDWADVAAFYLRIEGIGWWDSDASVSRTVYLFTRTPSSWSEGSTKKFVNGLSIPGQISHALPSVLGGVESPSNMDFEFVDTFLSTTAYQSSGLWASIFASSQAIFGATSTYPTTYLAATLTRSATSATVESTSGFSAGGGQICIGNETMTYDALAAGPARFTTVTRGLHPVENGEEFAYRHRYSAGDEITNATQPIVSTKPYTFYNRKVALYAIHKNGDGTWGAETDAKLLWKGRITSRSWSGDKWRISARSIIGDLDRDFFTARNHVCFSTGYNFGAGSANPRCSVRLFDLVAAGSNETYQGGYTTADMTDLYHAGPAQMRDALNTLFTDAETASGLARDAWPILITRTDDTYDLTSSNPVGGTILYVDFHGAFAALFGVIDKNEWEAPRIEVANSGVPRTVDENDDPAWPVIGPVAKGLVSFGLGTVNTTRIDGPGQAEIIADQGDDPYRTASYALLESASGEEKCVVRIESITAASGEDPAYITYTPMYEYGIKHPMFSPSGGTFSADGSLSFIGPCRITRAFVPYIDEGASTTTLGHAILRILTSTGDGTNYSGTNYDVLPVDYGMGIDVADIDVASFENLKTLVGDAAVRKYAFIKPKNCREFLDNEMKALGLAIIERNGKITMRSLPTSGTTSQSIITLDRSNFQNQGDRATLSESNDGIYNAITVKSQWDMWEEDYSGPEEHIIDTQSVDLYGRQREFEINVQGRLSGETALAIKEKLLNRIGLYRFPYPRVERTLSRDLWVRIHIGDRVMISDETLPDQFNGDYGVSQLVGVVERVSYDLKSAGGRITVRLFPNTRTYPIAPCAEVTGYTGAGPYITVAASTFGGGASGGASANDVAMFAVDDKITIWRRDWSGSMASTTQWRRTISSISGNDIYLSSTLAGFSASEKYYVTFSAYPYTPTTSQKGRGSWMADTNGRVDTGHDFYLYWAI